METVKDLKVNLESKILASKHVVIVPHTRIDIDAFASAVGAWKVALEVSSNLPSCCCNDTGVGIRLMP